MSVGKFPCPVDRPAHAATAMTGLRLKAKAAVRPHIVIDWLTLRRRWLTAGLCLCHRPNCNCGPHGERIPGVICRPFCPVLPRFGLNNVAPQLHHSRVKGGVSHSALELTTHQGAHVCREGQSGQIKALRPLSCDLMQKRSYGARPSILGPGYHFPNKIRTNQDSIFHVPSLIVPTFREPHASSRLASGE